MEPKKTVLDEIPLLIWGAPSKKLYLYVHGQGGSKEEADLFADIASHSGWQVLSMDLPEHGERKQETNAFDPWHVVPELQSVMEYAKLHWTQISLFANSIGAWFSMLSFPANALENCLFVSPVLDMERLISNMMMRANVSQERLKQELVIPTSFGQTLSWEYFLYAQSHGISAWDTPTRILYGAHDTLVERETVESFAHNFDCTLTVMETGEHWFHTEEQLEVLRHWAESCLEQTRNQH